MKKLLLYTLLLTLALPVLAQDEISQGNDCYSKRQYQCAIDKYMASLDKRSYKDGERHLLEYRIGSSYAALKQPDKAKEYYQKAIYSKPEYMFSYWDLADIQYDEKNYTDAINNYQKAYDRSTTEKDKEDLTWWIATTQYEAKNYTAAIPGFRKIVSRQDKFSKTESYLGDCYYSLKKFDSALAVYNRALNNYKPGDSAVRFVKCFIGKCYRELGKYKEAEQMFDAALAIDANYGLPKWEKGILLVNKLDYAGAIEWYKKALPAYNNKPSDAYTLCGNIAACYENLGNYTESANWEIKRKAYSTNKYKDYLRIASLQYGKMRQPKEAEKTCTTAINEYVLEPADKLKSFSVEDYVKLNALAGKISLERKDTVQAMKYFETALKLNKNNYEANAGAAAIAWARKAESDYKIYYANIYKTAYDTLLSTRKDIANVYGRAAYTDAYVNKYSYYTTSVESALEFDSLQREAVVLWPIVLTNGAAYTLTAKRYACLSILNQAIKLYASDKQYVSDLLNSKAVMLESKDTLAIKKALEEAIKVYPENIRAWENLLKYYGSYDNNTGAVAVEKLIDLLKKKKDNITTSTAYVYKGDFLWRVNKKEDAKKAWQEALVWDNSNATAKERIKMQ
ncbi:tetratricopeptide repeat protein [Ferruginibacter sp.]